MLTKIACRLPQYLARATRAFHTAILTALQESLVVWDIPDKA